MDSGKDTDTTPLACSIAHGCPAKAQVRQHKKKTSAVKFFLCFQRDDVAFPCMVPVTTTPDRDLDVGKCSNQQWQPERHGFFHALKTVLFKTKLVMKIQERKSRKSFANVPPTKEGSIISGHTQEWSDHEDVPRMITKTNSSEDNTVFTYIKENEEDDFPTIPTPLLKNEETCQDQLINEGRRGLYHILKAVLFDTSMAKKIQARKSGKKYGANGSLKSSTEETCKEDHHDLENLRKSTSSLTNSSVFTSSSLASTTSSSAVSRSTSRSTSHSRSLSERIRSFRTISSSNLKANLRNLSDKIRSNSNHLKSSSRNKISLESINSSGLKEEQHAHFDDNVTNDEKRNETEGYSRSASGLCFLLISLLGLIVYGKLGAILCSSLWLVCIPLWSFGDYNSPTYKVIEKKKVTMSGEIPARTARTRTRIFQSQ